MHRSDYIALSLSLLAVLVTYLVTDLVFERMPHIEDEMAYAWQAQVIAKGHLTLPSPPQPKAFLVPFVVDYQGQRFGKYPPGWPAMLAIGILLGIRSFVNPLLAGWGVWLTYRLGKRLFSELVGLLAAGLTVTSPFFLMNSGSLLSHSFGLFLSAAFALAWLDAWDTREVRAPNMNRWLPTLVAAFSLSLLILTRPLTAAGVCLPFTFHGFYLLVRGNRHTRLRLLVFIAIVLFLSGLLFLWQYAVTGDPLLNPYTLWWQYDKIGFGPGYGHTESGHTWKLAMINTRFSLFVGRHDLFGWGKYSWIFLPFGLLAIFYQRNWKALPTAAVFPCLIFVYIFYWIGSSLFGPRYYYEGLYSLTLLSAVGIGFLAGWPVRSGDSWKPFTGWRKARPLFMLAVVLLLVSANVFFYIPTRIGGMHGLYGATRSRLIPFLTSQAQALTPALVFVYPDRWTEYGSLLELETPSLDSPFIFVMNAGLKAQAALMEAFPQRTIIEYYPSKPFIFRVIER
jgi:4-amino-4-deoxy-L-arabinose transferase-like glycosyltransferase